jgi:hypothetical protein
MDTGGQADKLTVYAGSGSDMDASKCGRDSESVDSNDNVIHRNVLLARNCFHSMW